MFKRMFGPYESAADRWKGRLIWIFIILPNVCISYPGMLFFTFMYYEGDISGFQVVISWLVLAWFVVVGAYALLLINANAGRGKTTEHKIIETRIERPQFEYVEDDGEGYELESWTNKETPFGIESERVDTGLNEAQVLAHLKEFPPSTKEECKRLLSKYKKSKSIKLLLLGVSKEIKAKANTKAIRAANSDSDNHSLATSLCLDAYVRARTGVFAPLAR